MRGQSPSRLGTSSLSMQNSKQNICQIIRRDVLVIFTALFNLNKFFLGEAKKIRIKIIPLITDLCANFYQSRFSQTHVPRITSGQRQDFKESASIMKVMFAQIHF